jgi:hypothetical protein
MTCLDLEHHQRMRLPITGETSADLAAKFVNDQEALLK